MADAGGHRGSIAGVASPAESHFSDVPSSHGSRPPSRQASIVDEMQSHTRLAAVRTSPAVSRDGSRAVSPNPSAYGGATGGTAKARRTAEEKRRREETELRLLIQKEMDQARVLHARIVQNETQLAALAKQLEKQTESTDTEVKGLQGEVRKWERRLRQRQDVVAEKRSELQELDAQMQHLRTQKSAQRICLASLFLLDGMKPDVPVRPEDIFAPKQAASPSPHHRHRAMSRNASDAKLSLQRSLQGDEGAEGDQGDAMTSVDGGGGTSSTGGAAEATSPEIRKRRSLRAPSRGNLGANRRASVVVNELEVEPTLEYLRPRLHQVQHDANKLRSAFTQPIRADLNALYMELAALEHNQPSSLVAGESISPPPEPLDGSTPSGNVTPTAAVRL